MEKNSRYYIEKQNFVKQLSLVLNIAKPNLTCEYKLGSEIDINCWRDIRNYELSSEYVVVNCANGYHYLINVSANSLVAIAVEVFSRMITK